MKRLLARHSPLVILAGLCVVLAIVSEDFRKPENLQRVAYRTSVVGIIALGQTFVIITGGIDLAVGSVAALAGVVACLAMRDLHMPMAVGVWGSAILGQFSGIAVAVAAWRLLRRRGLPGFVVAGVGTLAGMFFGLVIALSAGRMLLRMLPDVPVPVSLAVLLGTLVGLGTGLVSGLLATKGRIPPFIATLGMMMVARGLVLLISKGVRVFGLPESFRYLGGARGWYIPVGITAAIAVVLAVALTFTRFGRAIFATGGNANGARLSGISVDRVRITAFGLCGALTAFAGVMLASRTGVAEPTAAEGMELDAIAACVIGGASLMGGEGGVIGSLAGALIMNVLVNFCNLKGFDVYWQKVLVGTLIVALVYYDNFRRRKAGFIKE